MDVEDFPPRLELALKALSISRGRLATQLGVDKSVVSRWLSGTNAPTGHNLSNLTALIGQRCVGFTMLDWESDLARFAARLGIEGGPTQGASSPPAAGPAAWLPARTLHDALATTAIRGDAYEGFWRSTRPSNEFPGRFIRDRCLIRKSPEGLLSFRLGVINMRFEGWAIPTQTQIFACGLDDPSGVFIFVILNAVLRDRADVMDGISLTLQRHAGGTPVAGAVLLERTGLLTGDRAADDARYEASVDPDPTAPDDSVPAHVRAHLLPDVGPAALAAGGDAMLLMRFATSMSRGPKTNVPFPE